MTTSRKISGGSAITIRHDMNAVAGTVPLSYEVLSDRKVTLDERKASEYIALPVFKGERDVSEDHVQFLYNELRAGMFNPLLVVLSVCVMGDTIYKINGQHTCWAVLFMTEHDAKFSIQVREIRYKVDTVDQLKVLYGTYDRLAKRDDRMVTKILLVETPETEGIPASIIQRVIPGLKFWLFDNSSDRARCTPPQVASLVRNHHAELFRRVCNFLQAHNEPIVRRAPTLGAMFATFDKLPHKAVDFWEPVCTGLNMDSKNDPRWRLRDLLLNSALNISIASNKRAVDAEALYRCSISAWNKWRTGESVSMTLRPTKERPPVHR
jgi:hypothetical protein